MIKSYQQLNRKMSLSYLSERKVDEKVNEENEAYVRQPRQRLPYVILACLLSVSLLVFLFFADPITSFLSTSAGDIEDALNLPPLVKDAISGDQYLLGVGKADITGLVNTENFMNVR